MEGGKIPFLVKRNLMTMPRFSWYCADQTL